MWKFLDIKFLDESKAVCKVCNAEISCGNVKDRHFTTSALYMHMRSCHSAEHLDAADKRQWDVVLMFDELELQYKL